MHSESKIGAISEAVCSVKAQCDSSYCLLLSRIVILCYHKLLTTTPPPLVFHHQGTNTDLKELQFLTNSANFFRGDNGQGALRKHIRCFSVDTYQKKSSCLLLFTLQGCFYTNQLTGKGENKGTEILDFLFQSFPSLPSHRLEQQQQLREVSRRLCRL